MDSKSEQEKKPNGKRVSQQPHEQTYRKRKKASAKKSLKKNKEIIGSTYFALTIPAAGGELKYVYYR